MNAKMFILKLVYHTCSSFCLCICCSLFSNIHIVFQMFDDNKDVITTSLQNIIFRLLIGVRHFHFIKKTGLFPPLSMLYSHVFSNINGVFSKVNFFLSCWVNMFGKLAEMLFLNMPTLPLILLS